MKVSWRGVRTSLERFEDMGGLLRKGENFAHCQVSGVMKPVLGTNDLRIRGIIPSN
jgi:hypothetical protein